MGFRGGAKSENCSAEGDDQTAQQYTQRNRFSTQAKVPTE